MKIKILLVIFVIAIGLTGCVRLVKLFHDDFEADIVGNPPSISPSGDPPGDALNMVSAPNRIIVINSIPLGSKAVKLERTINQVPWWTYLECITSGGPHTSGHYLILYRAYVAVDYPFSTLITIIKSSDGHRAFELVLNRGSYRLSSGDGEETLPGIYTVNVVHNVIVNIDLLVNRFWLYIDNTNVASNKPFLDSAFNNLHMLRFEYTQPYGENDPGTYVIDNIGIFRKE